MRAVSPVTVRGLLLAVAAAGLLLGGCRRFFSESVPEKPTAREQYEYASDLVEMTNPLPQTRERTPWRNQDVDSPYFETPPTQYKEPDYRRFARAFEAVVNRFPDDREYTPNAKVRLGEFHYLMEDHGLAATYYRDVIDAYPDDPILVSAGLFGLGNVRLVQGQYTDAQRILQRLVQEHGRSEASEVQELVQRAQYKLFQIQHQMGR